MNVLIVGSGGREHALAWKIVGSPLVTRLVCAPGNPGMAGLAETRATSATDIAGLTALAREIRADLVVVGPEAALEAGLAVIDVLDALGPLANDRSVTFDTRLPRIGEAMVVGDRDQILQVVQNLVENALKYSPEGGVVSIEVDANLGLARATAPATVFSGRLSLLTPDHSGGVRYAVLRVRDAGPGIRRANLPRLTERFYRVEGQKTGELSGTGLGLAIVKHIINRHRGGLIVESDEGSGTMFVVYVPMLPPIPA